MITKFKIFEAMEMKYDIGDYILIRFFNSKNVVVDTPALIIENDNDNYDHKILFLNGKTYHIFEDEIIRELTSQEIKDFEIKRTSKNYNL